MCVLGLFWGRGGVKDVDICVRVLVLVGWVGVVWVVLCADDSWDCLHSYSTIHPSPSTSTPSQGVLSSLNGRSGVVCEIVTPEEWDAIMQLYPTDYCLK